MLGESDFLISVVVVTVLVVVPLEASIFLINSVLFLMLYKFIQPLGDFPMHMEQGFSGSVTMTLMR